MSVVEVVEVVEKLLLPNVLLASLTNSTGRFGAVTASAAHR
jgi:hypothetical protein